MHDVAERCIFGVDINPLAAELAKVSLWLESMQPGRPLSFLSAHIKVGNSLIGATPALIAAGIPDEAFKAIDGDDTKHLADLKKRNKVERGGDKSTDSKAVSLFDSQLVTVETHTITQRLANIEAQQPTSLADVHLISWFATPWPTLGVVLAGTTLSLVGRYSGLVFFTPDSFGDVGTWQLVRPRFRRSPSPCEVKS